MLPLALLCSIALEQNLVAAQELEIALRRWMRDPSEPLVELLLESGCISVPGQKQLQRLVEQRLAEQGEQTSPSELFEALPNEFTFDELVDRGQGLGHSPDRVAEHLRTYQRFEMVDVAGEVIRKSGRKPYF